MSVAAGSGGGGDGGSGPSVNRVGPGPSWASSSSTSSSSMSAAPRKVQPASAASGAPTMQPAAASRLRLFLSTRRQQDCHICRDGGQVVLDQISGDQLCRNCGLILESKILSEEQEWRNFSGDSGVGSGDRSRVGEAVDTWLQDGIGGTTMLGGSKRLLQLNESTTSVGTNDRLLKSAFANLRLVAEALNLRDNVIETAKDIAKDLLVIYTNELPELIQLLQRDALSHWQLNTLRTPTTTTITAEVLAALTIATRAAQHLPQQHKKKYQLQRHRHRQQLHVLYLQHVQHHLAQTVGNNSIRPRNPKPSQRCANY
eukprot:GHVT01009574.1.p1 GENE.GHVT01009574.1~~GHVT01009574.1.p1  ORF type:complete len:314 (+),score=36.92 GHVT01009574.1:632-1573(+)